MGNATWIARQTPPTAARTAHEVGAGFAAVGPLELVTRDGRAEATVPVHPGEAYSQPPATHAILTQLKGRRYGL